ncbi:hypothetical protein [Arthrobacter sp. StoSoilA2]|uniref:hypothetical protein n=1 Tax=Arthrobacter sp. StoSoilA2 TaxID=2830990 RepID=UPI001CC6EEC0|nr:hypothetical protein [Arthrobacter sp. StoSoilA2]
MIVLLNRHEAKILEADDFRRLHVSTGLTAEGIGDALRKSGIGASYEDDHAVLKVSALRAKASSAARGPDWDAGWEKMIAYARSKGWLTNDETGLFAHVEFAIPGVANPHKKD